MALPEENLSIVEQWKKKSIEMSSESNDSIMSLLSRGIDTMAVVVNKKSDLDRIQRVLSILEYERSLSRQFDKIKNDVVRCLVYGLIESLHFTLSELTKDRNQVKECGESFTQTDQELFQSSLLHYLHSDLVKESAEMFTQTDKELSQPSLDSISSNDYADQSRDDPIVPNLLEFPKEEPFDESSIKIEDLWEDAMEIKEEEMPNDNVETNNVNKVMVGIRGDVSNIVHNDDMTQSEMPALEYMGDESHFENEDFDEKMSESANEMLGEDREKDSSESVEVDEKRRLSGNMSRSVKFADDKSLDNSDEDGQPSTKKMKAESSKRKNKTVSGTIKKKGRPVSSKGKSREMKCIECEYRTTSARTFTNHLRYVHSTTLGLAGLALLCDCGVDSLSYQHANKCDIANFTVIRKRDGPIHRINDEKMYPTTAAGYIIHLQRYHNTYLSTNGIYLLCSCGVNYRHCNPDSKHTKECTRREYTLHKFADP